jgi:hypothetical protein
MSDESEGASEKHTENRKPEVPDSQGLGLVAWDGIEPPTRGLSVPQPGGTIGLHLSLFAQDLRVTMTLDNAKLSAVPIETNSSAKAQPKQRDGKSTADDDESPGG